MQERCQPIWNRFGEGSLRMKYFCFMFNGFWIVFVQTGHARLIAKPPSPLLLYAPFSSPLLTCDLPALSSSPYYLTSLAEYAYTTTEAVYRTRRRWIYFFPRIGTRRIFHHLVRMRGGLKFEIVCISWQEKDGVHVASKGSNGWCWMCECEDDSRTEIRNSFYAL